MRGEKGKGKGKREKEKREKEKRKREKEEKGRINYLCQKKKNKKGTGGVEGRKRVR